MVPLFVWLLRRRPARRSGHTIGRVERWTPLVPRLLVILLLILAVAGLKLPAPPQSAATVFVIDQSASIPSDIQAATRSWVEGHSAPRGRTIWPPSSLSIRQRGSSYRWASTVSTARGGHPTAAKGRTWKRRCVWPRRCYRRRGAVRCGALYC